MYFIATKLKAFEKVTVSGPFESHALAEQGMVNLLGRNDVEQVSILGEDEVTELDPDEKPNVG